MDNDEEEIAITYIAYLATIETHFQQSSSRMTRQPRMRSQRGYEIVLECLSNDRRCMETTRMDSNCLRQLVDVFRHRYGVQTRGFSIGLEEQLVMTLHYLAYAGSMARISTTFGHVKDTMSRILWRMLPPLGQLFADEITPVDQSIIHPKFRTTPIRQAFQGCIGALDGTHVPVHPPEKDSAKWRGRPRIPTTNVLGICDHDLLLFTYFSAGAEGAYHDTRVLNRCIDHPRFRFPHPLPGKYYLCDNGYVNKAGFMAPYRYRRYHPFEFEHEGPLDSEEYFNYVHSGLRAVIERTFGVWKNKWHIVHKGNSLKGFTMDKQLAIIEATAALHNFVRRRMTEDYLHPVEEPVDQAFTIDLNRSPPPEEILEDDWTMDREQISRAIFQLR